MNFVVLKVFKETSKQGIKILFGRIQELYSVNAVHIFDTEILFFLVYFVVKSKLLNIYLFLSKRSIINPHINHK